MELRRELANARNRSNELLYSHLTHIARAPSFVRSGTLAKPSSPGLDQLVCFGLLKFLFDSLNLKLL